MKKFVFTIALVACTSLMKANTIENENCLATACSTLVENSEDFASNCWLSVEFIDEDGATVQKKDYDWLAGSLEDCFAKIAEKVKEYEANTAIDVKSFRSQYL